MSYAFSVLPVLWLTKDLPSTWQLQQHMSYSYCQVCEAVNTTSMSTVKKDKKAMIMIQIFLISYRKGDIFRSKNKSNYCINEHH